MPKYLADSDRDSLVKGSGLSLAVIESRGYFTAQTPAELTALGFPEFQAALAPALVVPIHTVDGTVDLYQIRPHKPRLNDSGKPIKYETQHGVPLRIDVPPSARGSLGDPGSPLWITEGSKKADSMVMRGITCIDLLGVWNWRGRGSDGGILELADWDRIAIKGRPVFIAFDSDVMVKSSVRSALTRLSAMLKRRGAREVHAVILPDLGDGGKCGLDDFFVAGYRAAELEDYVDDDILSNAIDVAHKSLPEVTARALEAVNSGTEEPRVYVRAGELVRVVVNDGEHPMIEALTPTAMRGVMASAVEWKRGGKVIFPPKDIGENIINLDSWPDVPVIYNVARAPVVSARCEISGLNGYHPSSKTYVLTGCDVPEFEGSARDAADFIVTEVLADFPFDGDSDLAHAVSLMVLPVVRPSIVGPTPLYLFDAPVQGTGKSLCAEVCLIPTQGLSVIVTPGSRDEEEWRKKIGAALLSGAPYLLFDNLSHKVDSDTLAACLTGTSWTDRMLGSMKMARAPIRCAWVATANNAELSRDILRRTAWIRLNSGLERPEDRTVYRHPNIKKWVAENRPAILSAIVKMVTEWIRECGPCSSSPRQYKGRRLGTFEEWSNTMGMILEVAGIPGFLGNIEELRVTASVEEGALADFYDRWWMMHQGSSVKASEVLTLWKEDDFLAGLVSPDKSEQTQATRLGRLLNQYIDVVRNGKRIVRAGERSNSTRFRMDLVKLQPLIPGIVENDGDKTARQISQKNGEVWWGREPENEQTSPQTSPFLIASSEVETTID